MMAEKHTLEISGEIDIILARMEVREFARGKGLNIRDQACISLTAASLAYAMGLEGFNKGQITVDTLNKDGCVGVRVICSKENASIKDFSAEKLSKARLIVHQLTVEEYPPNGVRITAIQWNDRMLHKSPVLNLATHG